MDPNAEFTYARQHHLSHRSSSCLQLWMIHNTCINDELFVNGIPLLPSHCFLNDVNTFSCWVVVRPCDLVAVLFGLTALWRDSRVGQGDTLRVMHILIALC